jgi:type III secretion protein V
MSHDTTLVGRAPHRAKTGLGRSYSDVLMVFGVVAIVALMVLPLGTPMIDALVAVNISVGLALLLIALYIPSPVSFSSFPSVLLLTTLFRLALGIATTRVILLEANGGHIIQTFGRLGAGGNLVVGVVVFLIITIVQFIVIAKGAERVAEVAARFTLDAMPGKQLSIDSDLRSGLLDKDEARRRRRHLEIESQLYGSLDGAMKFVKGDAIAGIIIIVVNLLGGFAVGILQRDMSLSQAVETYSILTIGDGLVSQIPALLASIAAGLVVTRTASEEQDRHLGDAVSRQLFAQPRVLLITGVIACLFALVPGFPKVVFLLLGVTLTTVGLRLMPGALGRAWDGIRRREAPRAIPEDGHVLSATTTELRPIAPLSLDLPLASAPLLISPSLDAGLSGLRDRLYQSLGIVIPPIDIRVDQALPAGHYRIGIFEVGSASGILPEEAPEAAILQRFEQTLVRHAGQFIGIQEVNTLLTRMGRDYPDLIKEVLRVIPLQKVTEVLRRLVDEQVSVRNLRDIFETLADVAQREKDSTALAEYVRVGLKRYLSERHSDATPVMHCVLLHPELEERIRQALRGTGPGAQIALDPDAARSLCQEIEALRSGPGAGSRPAWVLLTPIELRRPLRRLLESDFGDLPVLSYQELAADVRVQPVGQLGATKALESTTPGLGCRDAADASAAAATAP